MVSLDKILILFVVLVILAVIVSVPYKTPSKTVSINDSNAIADSVNQFGVEMYKQISSGGKNVFFSPYSISNAMAILYEGSNGKTRDEISNVFYFPKDGSTLSNGFHSLNILFDDLSSSGGCELRNANALWLQKGFPVLNEYIERIKPYGKETLFGEDMPIKEVDFISRPYDAVNMINNWVSENTNGKIDKLISLDTIDKSTRIVITNAIYFKGKWAVEFDPKNTHKDMFHSTNNSFYVDMMSIKDGKFYYYENKDVQVLKLPYDDDRVYMLIILPKQAINDIERNLSYDEIESWEKEMSEVDIDVFLPKFRFRTTYDLNDVLSSMGMPTVFTEHADLSGIDGRHDLYVSHVIHKAYIDVNEEGTEAAAATGITVGITSVRPHKRLVFKADHPFIFLIKYRYVNGHDVVLFMGKVVDPRS